MDAKESAALRELAQRPEWPVHELPASVDADSLRCLDDRGLVEAAFVVLQNVRTRPGDTTPDQPVRHAWFSPIAQPQMAGGWDRIRGAAPLRAAMTATRIKRVLHDDPDGPYPKRAEEIVETVELPEVPAYLVRVSERGKVELSRMNRKREPDTPPTAPDGHDCRTQAEEFLDAVRPLVTDGAAGRGWIATHEAGGEVRRHAEKLAMRFGLEAKLTVASFASKKWLGLAKALDAISHDPQPTVNWTMLRDLVEIAGLPSEYASPGGFPSRKKHPSPAPVGEGMSWQRAMEKAERHVKHKNGKFPGRNALAEAVGCSKSTMSKAIEASAYLKARRSEGAGRAKGRVVSLSAVPDAIAAPPAEPVSDKELVNRLAAEQTLELEREKRQHRAAQRGRGTRR